MRTNTATQKIQGINISCPLHVTIRVGSYTREPGEGISSFLYKTENEDFSRCVTPTRILRHRALEVAWKPNRKQRWAVPASGKPWRWMLHVHICLPYILLNHYCSLEKINRKMMRTNHCDNLFLKLRVAMNHGFPMSCYASGAPLWIRPLLPCNCHPT